MQQGASAMGADVGGLNTMSTGMTPAPAQSPVAGVSGASPTAKRPLQRGDVAMVEDGGPSKPMSLEELTHGFYNLLKLQDRDA